MERTRTESKISARNFVRGWQRKVTGEHAQDSKELEGKYSLESTDPHESEIRAQPASVILCCVS